MSPLDLARLGDIAGALTPGAGPGSAPGAKPSAAPAAGSPGAFGSILQDSLSQVNDLQLKAEASIKEMATGGATSLHETMIALEKAETSFKLMMQVRNKIVDAYHEVLRMQI
jgi:flagellar hook-basal body complex protein FliE